MTEKTDIIKLSKLNSERKKNSNILTLTTSEHHQLFLLLNNIEMTYKNSSFEEFLWVCYQASDKIPLSIQKLLFDLKTRSFNNLFLLKNLPIPSSLSNTPIFRGSPHSKAALMARKLLPVILSKLGLIYTFNNKTHFDFIDDVFPVEQDKHQQIGSNKEFLEWHVEDGFHAAKADWVALLCLRGDPKAQTHLFHAKDIDLDAHHMTALRRKDYVIKVDKTFKSDAHTEQKVAVLSEHEDPEIIYDPAYMRCLSKPATDAFRELYYFISEHKQTYILSPGDLLVFDNRRTIHARSEYEPRYDGTDRWLLRALIMESKFRARDCFKPLTLRVL